MKVFLDVFNGDELLSDGYAAESTFSDVCLEVRSQWVSKGSENVDIGRGNQFGGGDEEEKVDDTTERVLDIADVFHLNQIQPKFTKKEFGTYIKAYMQRLKKHIEENDATRVRPFMEGASAFVKAVLGRFEDYEFWSGVSYDQEALIVLSYYKAESDLTPTFVYFKDGLREVKY